MGADAEELLEKNYVRGICEVQDKERLKNLGAALKSACGSGIQDGATRRRTAARRMFSCGAGGVSRDEELLVSQILQKDCH